MTNGEEEAVNGNVEKLLIRFSCTSYEVCSLYAVFSKESERVAFEEDFNFLIVEDAVLHRF